MVDVTQTADQDTRSVQVESTPQRARWAASAQCSLLGHLCPSSDRQTVRFFLILSILLGWQSRQLNFIMAYPQARHYT